MAFKFYISGSHEGTGSTVWHSLIPGRGEFFLNDQEEEGGEMFSRVALEGKIILTRSHCEFVLNAPFDTKFTIIVTSSAPSLSLAKWVGEFYRADCFVDEDESRVEVENIEVIDKYKEISEGKGKEFDLIATEPPFVQLDLVRRSIVQVYVRGADKLTNYVDSTFWEQTADNPSEVHSTLLGDYRFGYSGRKYFVTGEGTGASPDVSGIYIFDGSFKATREDGEFDLFTNTSPSIQVVIRRVSDGVDVYKGTVGEILPNVPVDSAQGILLDSETTTSKVRAFYVDFYSRILTNQATVNGDATFEIGATDILSDTGIFKRVHQTAYTNFIISEANVSPDGSRWGKFPEGSQHFEGRHYLKPSGGVFYPVLQSQWIDASFWITYDAELVSDMAAANEDYTIKHCYKLADVVKNFLVEMGSSASHEETEEHSSFLYGDSNQIRGEKKIPLIIPISNILVGDYDEPQPVAKLKFEEILQLMKFGPRVYYYIDGENRFKFEHLHFYENGGSYTAENIGIDLTELYGMPPNKPWSFRANKYRFEKSEMPERFEFGWQGKSSKPFDGYPLEVLSPFIKKGDVKNWRIGRFYADVDLIHVGGAEVSKESFLYVEAIEKNGRLVLPFVEVEIDAEESYNLQNGYASFVWMVPNYHLYGLPASSIKVNKATASAVTVARRKLQALTIATSTEVSTLNLTKTTFGNGKAFRVKIDIFGTEKELNLRHANE